MLPSRNRKPTPLDELLNGLLGPLSDLDIEQDGFAKAKDLRAIRRGVMPSDAAIAMLANKLRTTESVVRLAIEMTVRNAQAAR